MDIRTQEDVSRNHLQQNLVQADQFSLIWSFPPEPEGNLALPAQATSKTRCFPTLNNIKLPSLTHPKPLQKLHQPWQAKPIYTRFGIQSLRWDHRTLSLPRPTTGSSSSHSLQPFDNFPTMEEGSVSKKRSNPKENPPWHRPGKTWRKMMALRVHVSTDTHIPTSSPAISVKQCFFYETRREK